MRCAKNKKIKANTHDQTHPSENEQEGRNSKVQALFYDEKLLGRGDRKTPATSMVKTELLSSARPAPAERTPLAAIAPPATQVSSSDAAAAALAGSGLRGSGAPNVGHGKGGSADGGGDGAGGGSGVGGEAGLGDVNWSDDEALDAMVDDIGREVDGKKRRRNGSVFFSD